MGTENTAHGTALLTSLRTIAGAIGTAVFVGILNVVSDSSRAASYGNAGIYGLRVALVCMTAVTVVMFIIMLFGIKTGKHK